MNTLWVFGDSFASDKNHWYYYNNQRDEWKCPDWFWPNQLANKLNCDLKLTALPGVSNEWISHQVRTTLNKQQFQQNDFIVIVTTQPSFGMRSSILTSPSASLMIVRRSSA